MSDAPKNSTLESIKLPQDTEVVRRSGVLIGFICPGPGSSWRSWEKDLFFDILVDGPPDRSKQKAIDALHDELVRRDS